MASIQINIVNASCFVNMACTKNIFETGIFAIGKALLKDAERPKFFLGGKEIDICQCPHSRLKDVAYIKGNKVHFLKDIFSIHNQEIFRNFIKWSNGIDDLLHNYVNVRYDKDKDRFMIIYMDKSSINYAVEFEFCGSGNITFHSCQCEYDSLFSNV